MRNNSKYAVYKKGSFSFPNQMMKPKLVEIRSTTFDRGGELKHNKNNDGWKDKKGKVFLKSNPFDQIDDLLEETHQVRIFFDYFYLISNKGLWLKFWNGHSSKMNSNN